MTITINLPRLAAPVGLVRTLRALWPLAVVAIPVLAEAAGASVLICVLLEVAVQVTDQAVGAPQV
ncbi:hypothetical protein [Acrocarpospora catenulata]|uniref:hypothetical protein n=1 Tax=Acrocarpospora catenulata TaxID=2836182 RepID=UPI001BD95507|nr:hypothetical protein [Acrocarpospora catenulata]